MLKPVNGKVVIEVEQAREKTVSGIILTAGDTSKSAQKGVIIAIEDHDDLSVGNKVIFDRYDGVEVEDEGKKLLLIDSDKILAVVES